MQFTAQGGPVDDRFRLFHGNAANSPLLDELTLESEKRSERVVSRLERFYFLGNAEQLAQKIFDMGGKGDDKFRLLFGCSA